MVRKKSNVSPVADALSTAQREIMELIWEHGEMSASAVRAKLAENREVARNTVRTLMERMEAKGWLTHRLDGRTYLYSAAVPRQTSIGQKVLEVVDEFCGGKPEQLVNALLDYRGLSSAELRRIEKLLEDARKHTKKRGK